MKQMYKLLVVGFLFMCNTAFAQKTITGTVTSSGDPVIGANVVIEGTTTGTVTDVDGKFSLPVDDNVKNLIFSYVGLKKKVVPLGGSTTLSVTMEASENTFDDVVVTALAVKREQRSLGYSTTTIKSEDLNKVNEGSALNALQGKVAGAQITNATGAPGGSTRVVLRGGSSLTGDNNALIVVDGVPIDNSNFGFDDVLNNQYDAGNRGNDINPQDIESVTVLKGAAAVALYGQRGANGVIVYTTKTGKDVVRSGRKFKVSLNTNFTFQTPLKLPEYQSTYGQGLYGTVRDLRENSSWGPAFDGIDRPWGQAVDGDQRVKPYSNMKDNLGSFFRLGTTYNNNVSVSGGSKNTSFYGAFNNIKYNSIVPGAGYQRNSVRFNINQDFGDKLSVMASLNYTKTQGDLVAQGQSDQNMYFQLLNIPTDIPIKELADLNNKFNKPENYFGYYYPNPYWVLENNKTSNNVDRFLTNINLDYKPTKWLAFTGRFGADVYTDTRTQRWKKYTFVNRDPSGSKSYAGKYSEDNYTVNNYNGDLMVRAANTFKGDYYLSGMLGFNIYHNKIKNTFGETSGLVLDDFYSFSNSQDRPTLTNSAFTKRIMGVYADITFAYKNYLFIDLTGRNDWSSTLPTNNRSYFYPGVSASFVFSDLIKQFTTLNPMILSYGKIRASFAVVGKDAEPYQLKNVFGTGDINDGYPNTDIKSPYYTPSGNQVAGYSVSSLLRNPNLKPEISNTWEIGTDLSFLKDRVTVELTYFDKLSKNEIITAPVAPSSGFTNQVINAGVFSNKGVELAVRLTPVSLANGFKWEVYGTFTKVYSKVVKVADNAEQVIIGGFSSMSIVAQKDQPYGSFYAVTLQRDAEGHTIVDSATGMPLVTPKPEIVGSFTPNWTGSLGTSLSWNGLKFSILLDARVGGKVYSNTKSLQQFLGEDPLTLYADRKDFVVPNSVYKGEDGLYHTNKTTVIPINYWGSQNGLQGVYSNFLVDATFLKIREISLSYALPAKQLKKTKFLTGLEFNVFGSNLAMWVPKSNTYIDPEVGANGARNGQGFEYSNLPSLRSFGVGMKADF